MRWAIESTSSDDPFLATGSLHSLVEIFKHGERASLLEFVQSTLEHIGPCVVDRKTSLQRKLLVKLVQRMGLALLPLVFVRGDTAGALDR